MLDNQEQYYSILFFNGGLNFAYNLLCAWLQLRDEKRKHVGKGKGMKKERKNKHFPRICLLTEREGKKSE